MLTYTLFMVPSGKQQLVCDLVGGARAPELALELELAAVLDCRDDDPREVLALGIMGMVSIRRLPAGALLCCGSCLGRRHLQQHAATRDPRMMKATNTEPTMRNGTYMGTGGRAETRHYGSHMNTLKPGEQQRPGTGVRQQ